MHFLNYILVTLAFLFCFSSNHAQTIEWEKNYGGSDFDFARSIQQTADGGYIMVGQSGSQDQDVSANKPNIPYYWVVKLDSVGNIEWENIYGGSGNDKAYSIQQTTDEGYIVVGESSSKDQDVSGNHGEEDYWVVKLDSAGSIEWENSYGGSGTDKAYSIQQTTDKGYIVAGEASSTDQDVGGNYGKEDYWVVKLDSVGSIEWENNYGGSLEDKASAIQQTDDGGYFLAGFSKSADHDVSENYGKRDYWVVKLDTAGIIEWESNYGGSEWDEASSIQQTADGSYIVAGFSGSNDQNVSGNYGGFDFWILKLNGNSKIEWENNYGGSHHDLAFSIQQIVEGGFIVAGESKSTDHDLSGNYGERDYWVVKLDMAGAINWENNYGGSSRDMANFIQKTEDGGYVVMGKSKSADHDVSSNYGRYDYWVVKLDKKAGTSVRKKEYKNNNDFLNAYPSSATGKVRLKYSSLEAEDVTITVVDLSGRTLQRKIVDVSKTPDVQQTTLDLSKLVAGTYIINLWADGQQVDKEKVQLIER